MPASRPSSPAAPRNSPAGQAAAGKVIAVRCMRCDHRATLSESMLVRFGLKPGAPITSFIKRLRCRKCGSGSVLATRSAASLDNRQKKRA